jgi:omega-amidase
MHIRISLAQINIAFGQPEINLEKARSFAAKADQSGCDLFLLPELWHSGYDLKNCRKHALAAVEGIHLMTDISRQSGLVCGGSLIERSGENFYNTFYCTKPGSETPCTYRKIHLIRLFDEHSWFQPGQHLQKTTLPGASAGMAICYDLRFPEMFRVYSAAGVPIVLIVAQWPIQRIEHWRVLLQARAIENQVFIAAVNCVGKSGPISLGGRSALISPWGEILAEGSQDHEELLQATIDLEEIAIAREKLPVLQDQRPSAYHFQG